MFLIFTNQIIRSPFRLRILLYGLYLTNFKLSRKNKAKLKNNQIPQKKKIKDFHKLMCSNIKLKIIIKSYVTYVTYVLKKTLTSVNF